MRKKYFSLLLSLILMITTFAAAVPGTAAAGVSPAMKVGNAEGYGGDTVSVRVVIDNNPGFCTASVEIKYDAGKLELTDAGLGSVFASGANVSANLPYLTFVNSKDITDSDFLTLTFKISENAAAGDTAVTVSYGDGDISNRNEDDVNFEVIGGKVTVKAAPVSVTGISLDRTTASVKTGESVQLNATVSPENATDKTVTWATDNASVATVTNAGLVKGIKKGTATVTATSSGGKKASCVVSVACSHANTTSVPAAVSTCTVQGNGAYTKCGDCGEIVAGSSAKLPLAAHAYVEKAEAAYLKAAATCVKRAVYYKSCSVCGEKGTETFENGEPDAGSHVASDWKTDDKSHYKVCTVEGCGKETEGSRADHTEGAYVTDKEAAVGVAGSAHTECTVCKKVMNTKELPALIAYDVISGNNGEWSGEEAGAGLSFRAAAEFKDFSGVRVDGKTVDTADYEVSEGSTVVTLKKGFLESLSAGSHVITIVFTDGEARADFKTAKKEPETVTEEAAETTTKTEEEPETTSTAAQPPVTGDGGAGFRTAFVTALLLLAGLAAAAAGKRRGRC